MKLVFLGTSGGMPTKERGLPSLALVHGGVHLFDIGEGTQRQMMLFGVRYGAVKNVFVSHLHPDHYLGLFGLLETYRMAGRSDPLRVYLPMELPLKRPAEVHLIREGLIYEGRLFRVWAFRVPHTKDSFGFLVETGYHWRFNPEEARRLGLRGRLFSEILKRGRVWVSGRELRLEDVAALVPGPRFVYTGDTVFSEKVVKACKDAVLVHDSTFSEADREEAKEKRHATSVDAAKAALKGGATFLYLTHFSPRYQDVTPLEEEAKKIFEKTKAAYDGLEVNLFSHRPSLPWKEAEAEGEAGQEGPRPRR